MPQYVIYGLEYEPAYELFREVIDDDNITFIRHPLRAANVPFSKLTYKLLKKKKLPKGVLKGLFAFPQTHVDDEIVFIYTNPWIDIMMRSGFLDVLKEKYPNSHHVAIFLDIHAARTLNIDLVKQNYDKIITYDQQEAKTLGIEYLPPMYSKNFSSSGEKEQFDLAFLGLAKKRYPELMKVYRKLKAGGLKCRFYIVGVPENDRCSLDGVTYGDELLSPEQSFEIIDSARCLLEIQLHETQALTARVREAVVYDKKLLTNNPNVADYKYFNPQMMQIYKDPDLINLDFFKKENKTYNYMGEFSPRIYLESIYTLIKSADKAFLSH